ncbi:2-C-methyl-D-erythritol 4-phosphate cytidylyltransferase [Thermosynechococcaceae cyanobacterium BACA0444]|uniref:2-C-methyl-D-erythritol 4-phosphate cytidylyltransferase n=1 Tax=Pseudocalidococcus azoricus BACA0444 TaxID=2918990 RepID=A0AAE4FRZ8_9CYAN|nr:2-C-methyl-D-erythritol 4-phosphate cytidylyltransferase [Pseudocalidococcus azoricus]MDS3860678.1 2-C-methyl-D-erythritol 4-phosphate cytidylyltransferase [Pseudocalidococcus azoricus BACA0444]
MHLLIPAAGLGKRMGSHRNKLLLEVLGRPLLAWTLTAIRATPAISWLGIIGQPGDFPDWQVLLAEFDFPYPTVLIPGGKTRQESVYNGLQALPDDATQVLIHDGARCLATPDLFQRCAQALENCSGFVAAIPVKDTIKIVNSTNIVTATPNRDFLWAAQTPQGFWVQELKDCHQKGRDLGLEVTDDAALFEKFDLPVQIVMGEETNLKITTPADLALAEQILKGRFNP